MLVVFIFKSWPEVPTAPCSMQFIRYAVPEPVRVVAVATNMQPAEAVVPVKPMLIQLAEVEDPIA